MARILIVDDSPTETYRFKEILERHGHVALEAANGADGVAVARAELPDLVLMDVVMQITKGADTAHIPVVIVTTKDQETDRVWGKRQGACDYLTKPVDESLLMKVIHNLIPGK